MARKRHGKMCFNHVDNEAIKNKDVLKEKTHRLKKISKADIDEKIKTMMDEIHSKYTYEKCMDIVHNSEIIPFSLIVLLVPNEYNDFAVWNLDYHYNQYQHGNYKAYEFLCKVEALFVALVKEFDNLVDFVLTGSIKNKEDFEYERT